MGEFDGEGREGGGGEIVEGMEGDEWGWVGRGGEGKVGGGVEGGEYGGSDG